MVIGFEAIGRLRHDPGLLHGCQPHGKRAGDLARDAVLNGEDAFRLGVILIRPQQAAGRRIGEPNGDADPLWTAPDAALREVPHFELATELLGPQHLAFEWKDRLGRKHRKLGKAPESGDDVFRQPVGEIVVGRGTAKGGQRQHRDRNTL